MTEEQISNLYGTLKTLPPEARNWLTSDEIVAAVAGIAQELVLSRAQEIQIPLLILRLVTQNLPPENFKQEMIEILSINQELAEKIIDALKEKILMPIEKPLNFAGVDINLLRYNAPAASPAETFPVITTPSLTPVPTQNKPFILHEEPSLSPQPSSFIFNSEDTINQSLQTAPPKVIIERVVHYNTLRTPLTQAAVTAKEKAGKITIPKSKWFTI